MSDFLYTKITAFGQSIEIMTPKNRPDAQHEHTVAYFAAYTQLREREADRVQEINSYIADQLRKPVKPYSRENPAGLTVGSSYTGDKRLWRPALPVEYWKAPQPLSAKQAASKRAKILARAAAGDYAPKNAYGDHREAFTELTFEEVGS